MSVVISGTLVLIECKTRSEAETWRDAYIVRYTQPNQHPSQAETVRKTKIIDL